MNTKFSLLTLGLTTVMVSSVFAGDIKPLLTPAQLNNQALPATAGQICDVYRLRRPNADATKLYTSANVMDSGPSMGGTIQKPKLGVKVGKWNGSDCVAAGAAEGQVHVMHVTGGGVAYDEGAGVSSCGQATASNQWPLTGGSTVADGNGVRSKYSTMNNTTTDYCVQVCKYPSSQHTGTAPTNAGAETYSVDAETHIAASSSTTISGHCSTQHSMPIFVSQLCNDTAFASCAYSF